MQASFKYYRRSIDALMDEAGRHSVPTAEEEAILVRKAQRGDARATHGLVLGHLRLVIKLAHRMGGAWSTDLMEELSAAGINGMIEAIGQYRAASSNGGRFMHYAIYHVRRQMRRTLSEFRTPVSANPNNYDLARKIIEFEETSLKQNGYRPTHEETGKKFGLTPNRVERTKKLLESPMYLDHPVGSEDERDGHDLCADTRSVSPALATEKSAESELIAAMMAAHLNEREVAVLKRRFGFNSDGEEEDLQTIGSDYDLSRERVRQIEASALKKLRFHLAQACPTYRQRSDRAMGIHSAILPSEMPVKAMPKTEPVVVVKAPARKAVKLSVVKTSKTRRVAVAA